MRTELDDLLIFAEEDQSYSQQINDLDRQITDLKAKRDFLKLQRDKMRIDCANMIGSPIEYQGLKFSIEKGRPSAHIKPKADVPEQFIRRSPDKAAILKAWKSDPDSVADFADIEVSPDKLKYEML